MDYRRILLWAVLLISVLVMWESWVGLNQKNPPASTVTPPAVTDSQVPQAVTAPLDSASGSAAPVAANVISEPPQSKQGFVPQGETVSVTTDTLTAVFSTQGGQLQQLTLLGHKDTKDKTKPVTMFDTVQRLYLLQAGLIGTDVPTHKSQFKVLRVDSAPTATGTQELVLQATQGGVELTRSYQFKAGSYVIAIRDQIRNLGQTAQNLSAYYQLVHDNSYPDGKPDLFTATTYTGPAYFSELDKFKKISFDDLEKTGSAIRQPVKAKEEAWVSMLQHYFATVLLVPDVAREIEVRQINPGVYGAATLVPLAPVAAGASVSVNATLFVGPQESALLEPLSPNLDLIKDYGILTILAKPIFIVLAFLHSFLGNWGWSIVFLTLLLKLLFYPLSAASYKSMARMKKIMPRMQSVRERYADDKMRMNQAMMELYKTEKINPLGGCLPILIQIPVFIALYWVLLASAEMRGAPWLGWIQNLSEPDPFYILPIVMAVSMFIQTKLNPTPADPLQAKVMMFMPIIFSVFFFFFPAGLVLYWVVNNIVSIAQQWVITKKYGR